MANNKFEKKELIRKISKLIAAEMDSTIFGPGGGGSEYDCTSASFTCGNEYNCKQSVSCSNHYTDNLKGPDGIGKRVINVKSDITKQIAVMLEQDIGKMIDPIISMGRHCDADSFSCNEDFSCSGGIGFRCTNKFSG